MALMALCQCEFVPCDHGGPMGGVLLNMGHPMASSQTATAVESLAVSRLQPVSTRTFPTRAAVLPAR